MENKNTTRSLDSMNNADDDFNFYLKSGLGSEQVISYLRKQGKSEDEITKFIEKYKDARRRISKLISKFVQKIRIKYGQLDTNELMMKGLKFATKHGFTPAEREAFIRYVTKGTTEGQYLPFSDTEYTDMYKFLGFTEGGPSIMVKPTDQSSLNEIASQYEKSLVLFSAIKNNVVTYDDCVPAVIFNAQFEPINNKMKYNTNVFIHPVIFALFLTKIPILTRRMLLSNIGRMVIARTQQYFLTRSDKRHIQLDMTNISNCELYADNELAFDIAKDPNSLNYLSEETPMVNLLKRYNVQIELWKNVLNLRNGRLFSKSDSLMSDDGITGLQQSLKNYDSVSYDSPHLNNMQDEGTFLRRLLAVFSFRPTLAAYSNMPTNFAGAAFTNVPALGTTRYVTIPIVNLWLNMYDVSAGALAATGPINLQAAFTQNDYVLENNAIVRKAKRVVWSDNIMFFYIYRRYQEPSYGSLKINYMYMPGGIVSTETQMNKTEIATHHEDGTIAQLNITAKNSFDLISATILNVKPKQIADAGKIISNISMGCSALVWPTADCNGGYDTYAGAGAVGNQVVYYNPMNATKYNYDNVTGAVSSELSVKIVKDLSPIFEDVNETSDAIEEVTVYTAVQKYSSILVYGNRNPEDLKRDIACVA